MSGYDPLRHAQTRARKAEACVAMLERERDQLVRIVGMMLADWFRDRPELMWEYLGAWVDIDRCCEELGV